MRRVDHIGIVVKDIEQAKKFYTEFLGIKALGEEVVVEQKVKVCFIPCGDSEIELLGSQLLQMVQLLNTSRKKAKEFNTLH